jgi:hypothetical protein
LTDDADRIWWVKGGAGLVEPATKVAGLAKKRPSATNCRRKALAALQVMIRDPEPALRLIADAAHLRDELQEALPELVPEV